MNDKTITEQDLKRLVLWLIGWKFLFFLFVVVGIELFPGLFHAEMYRGNFHMPPDDPTWGTHFQTWDAQHYLFLSEHGYNPRQTSNGLFPLWPLVIRAGSVLFGGSHLWSGLILANALSCLGMVLFWVLVLEQFGKRSLADASLVFILACPGSLFFSFVYSESLFFCLAVFMMLCLSRGRWGWAVAASVFLPITRGIGGFLLIPLGYEVYLRWRREGRLTWRDLGCLGPLLGGGIYCLLMVLWTGDAWIGFREHGMFVSDRTVLRLVDLPGFVASLLNVGSFHGYLDSAMDRAWFLFLVAWLYPIWKLDRRLFFYTLAVGFLPAMTSFMDYTRFFVMAFPIFMVLGKSFHREDRRGHRWLLLAGFVGLQGLLTLRHVNNYWVG